MRPWRWKQARPQRLGDGGAGTCARDLRTPRLHDAAVPSWRPGGSCRKHAAGERLAGLVRCFVAAAIPGAPGVAAVIDVR